MGHTEHTKDLGKEPIRIRKKRIALAQLLSTRFKLAPSHQPRCRKNTWKKQSTAPSVSN